jgi:hypothetical protein
MSPCLAAVCSCFGFPLALQKVGGRNDLSKNLSRTRMGAKANNPLRNSEKRRVGRLEPESRATEVSLLGD